MGFDNECILNIQSLPGEYFCPVCRTLIYPNEALQAQCTHLYCKPCLTYVASTTQACPYDGYLVSEADSKPLVDSNKSLAETIGKVTVHCLYNKSGCQWQGNLSECITHGTVCAYGNSPVVCNRCSTQIVHRQVQEHAQLCPSLQPHTQQADSSLAQSAAATTQTVTQDQSAVSSAAIPAAPLTAVPPATAAGAISTSAPLAPSLAAAPTAGSQGQAVAPQSQTAEQYQQQLQYQQYYQQHYPGYNPYAQQYQQFGQYQQVYQQYAQPQMQVPPQNVAQAPAQPAPYVQPQVSQPTQPQHMVPNHPQNQSHLPQFQAPVVQPQPQPQQNPPQSATQIPQVQPQSEVPLQLPHPQAQPTAHTQVGNQQFAMPVTQAAASQVQPHVQPHPPHHQQVVAQQHPQMQHLSQHQHIPSQIQVNSQFQHQHPQVQQQSYPQSQVYHQPHSQPQNSSIHVVAGHQPYPQPQPPHQMPHDASLQRPVHVSHQQAVAPHHTPMTRPPQGQYPLQVQPAAMVPSQGTQQRPQNQHHAAHHAQRPPMHPSAPFQAPPQGFPLNTSVPSQTGQSYQQGMPSSQQMHPQPIPIQPHGPPFMQQQHVQTSTGRSMSYVAAPQQFQDSRKLENATNASSNSEVSDKKNGGANFSALKTPSLGEKNVIGEQNDIANIRKDAAHTGITLDGVDSSDKGKGKDEPAGRQSNGSNTANGLEKGGSVQQASQQNLGTLGSHVAPGMVGPQRPSGPDRILPQHMLHPGPMSYMQGQPNQTRPPKHNVPESVPMQHLLYGSYQSEIASSALAPNQNQMPIPQPAPNRSDDGMMQPPMGGPLPGHHGTTVPPFASENVGRPHPVGTTKINSVGGVPLGNSRAFYEEGLDSSRDHFRPPAAYPGRHNVNHNDFEDNMNQFPAQTHPDADNLQRGPRTFDGGLGQFDSFSDSLPGRPSFQNMPGLYPVGFPDDLSRKHRSTAGHSEFGSDFDHHRIDGMPRNPGPIFQGMTAAPGGIGKGQLGSGNLPGNIPHVFDNPEFPHAHLHPGDAFVSRKLHGGAESLGHGRLHGIEHSGYRYQGHMHPDDPNLADYSQHGFPQESGHFGSGGSFRSGDVGWCRICMFNCGSAEGLDRHVHTREHQQHAMDIVLKMKHDVAKRQKMNSGGPKSFNKKVTGKGNFRGNRR